jgi:ATP-binding cassette, subfamily B, multidrug efflux pump
MAQEEEVLGKAYDSRLMKRLLQYLRPYKWPVGISLVSILIKSVADVLGPYLVAIEIDRYLVPVPKTTPFDFFLSTNPYVGIAQIAGMYVGLIALGFLLDYLQTYFMQWAGQMVMFDLRKQIFRHLQGMHIGFYDKNPVGRLVTRVTSDVDALNEMFTSGVVSIFEDVFVLAGITAIMLCMNWKLALITLAVLPLIGYATSIFRDKVRDSYRRIRTAIARINSYMQEHVSGMVVLQLFNREQRSFDKFSEVNAVHMEAFKDAIMAHAVYYPVVEILSSTAIACVIWFGGNDIISKLTVGSVAADFSRQHLLSFHVVHTVVSIGTLTAFIQYAQRFFRPIQDFSEKYNILQSAMAASERVFRLLDTPAEITSPVVTKTPTGPGRIEFDHVWFAYRDVPVEGAKTAGESPATTQSMATPAKTGNGHVGTGLRPGQAEQSSAEVFDPTAGLRPAQPGPFDFAQGRLRLGSTQNDSARYDEPSEADRYQMIRTYFEMLIEEEMPGAEGKMKQFASWFTHGVAGGAALRKAIYESKSRVEILSSVEAFFETRLSTFGAGAPAREALTSIL